MKSKLNDFVFTGILASHCVKDLQTRGLLRSPLGSEIERKDSDLFAPVSETIRGGSIQMQRWYRMLYVFENIVREFITQTFLDIDGDTWFDKRASKDMKKSVTDRKAKEAKNQWHTGRNEDEIYYLDFGHLGLLITNHWDVFKDFFPDQAWVTSRIQDAEKTRNVIAHTNVLSSEEGLRLEMYLRDFLRQIS